MKKLLKLLGPAAQVATVFNPALAPVVGVLNAVLPKSKQLPPTATGPEAVAAYESLPASKQATVDTSLDQLELQTTSDNLALMVSKEQSGSWYRPAVVLAFAGTLILITVLTYALLFVALLNANTAALETLLRAWPLIATLASPLVAVIYAYFGLRSRDKASRYAVAAGQAAPPAGILSALASRIVGAR